MTGLNRAISHTDMITRSCRPGNHFPAHFPVYYSLFLSDSSGLESFRLYFFKNLGKYNKPVLRCFRSSRMMSKGIEDFGYLDGGIDIQTIYMLLIGTLGIIGVHKNYIRFLSI